MAIDHDIDRLADRVSGIFVPAVILIAAATLVLLQIIGEADAANLLSNLGTGLNTNIEVLDGQRDLFRAKRDYLKERYDYVLEILQLEALIGNLDSDDLRRVNAWLN